MKLRTAIYSATALALAATGSLIGLGAASSASAATLHSIPTTSVLTHTTHVGPRVTITDYREYTTSSPLAAPGFTNTADVIEVCLTVPHITPAGPFTVLAVCNWRLSSVPAAHPANTLHGTAFENGVGQIGRVTGGTGIWAGASGGPGSYRALNLAPKTQADVFAFSTP